MNKPLEEWGALMRLARSATNRALEAEKVRLGGGKFDKLSYDVILYTDDPTSAILLHHARTDDLAMICGVSSVEEVCVVTGENFPPDAAEAPRSDPELPRLAALLLKAQLDRCPRCWNYTVQTDHELCGRCESVLNA